MASSTGSDNSASTEKRSSKDKNNNKSGSDEENTSSSNPNGAESDIAPSTFSSDFTPPPASETVITGFDSIQLTGSICLVVDLPIYGAQLHSPLVSKKDGSTDDQAQKGEPKEILKEEAKKEAAQGREVAAAAKQQKGAQVEEDIRVTAKRLRDVFDDGSRVSSVRELIPLKRPTRIINASYNKKDQVPAGKDTHSHQPLTGNRMHSCPNSLYSRFPGIRLTVDLPIHEAQLHPPLVSNKDGSTDDQAQKGKPEEVLKEKAKKEAAQGREVAAAAKQQKGAQVEENIRVMAERLRYVFGDGSRTYIPRKRLCDVFGDGSHTSSVGGFISRKPPIRTVNAAYNKNDQVPAGNDTHPHQPLIGNRMHSYPNSLYSRFPGIRLTVDLPIHGAQLHPLVSNKDGSIYDRAQKGEPKEVLEEKAKKEAAQGREAAAAAKQQKEAQVEENIRVMAERLRYVFGDGSRTYTPRKRLCDVFGDGSHTSSVGGFISRKPPIRRVNAAYNKNDQVPAGNDTHLEEVVGDNITDEQEAQVGEVADASAESRPAIRDASAESRPAIRDASAESRPAICDASAESRSAIRDDVVPVVKYQCPDLNFLPPEEDDEDYYY